MATYAVMTGNMVSNVIITNNKNDAELELNCVLIEYTVENPAGIGWTYNELSQTFIPPMNSTEVTGPVELVINSNEMIV